MLGLGVLAHLDHVYRGTVSVIERSCCRGLVPSAWPESESESDDELKFITFTFCADNFIKSLAR